MLILGKHKPTVLDVFCGAGGMSLGFRQAGCEILGGIDHNRHAVETHHRNFSESKLNLPPQDIRNIVNIKNLNLEPSEVDIVIGGPPCQVFSRVGIGKMRKLGRNIELDERNFLYKEFIRFVEYYRPLCFVMENVDNLARKTIILQEIIQGFKIQGYNVNHQILDASDFGVPQKRKRLFIIGIRSDLSIDPVFPDKTSELPVPVGEAISDLPPLEPLVIPLKTKCSGPKQVDKQLPYRYAPKHEYQERMRINQKRNQGVWNHICRSHNEKDIEIFCKLKQGQRYKDIPQELMRYRADIFNDKYKRLVWYEPSWTLTAHMRKDGLAYIHPNQDRSISVREAARIQSFPDDFIFHAPMTRMFELVGNSVPPLLAEAIAKPLVKIIQEYYQVQSHEKKS